MAYPSLARPNTMSQLFKKQIQIDVKNGGLWDWHMTPYIMTPDKLMDMAILLGR